MHLFLTIPFLSAAAALSPRFYQDATQVALQDGVIKVPVELGVMSRCPDALICEAVFSEVLKQVGPSKVDLKLVYVAELNSTEPDFGVTCMHGPGECAGNVQQLCAARYSSKWWDFVRCQNDQGRFQVGLPDVAFECAKEVGIDWETSGVGNCAGLDGSGKASEGVDLLRKSLLRGKALGIKKSCTVLINHEKVCVHDGSWQECEGGHDVDDFVKQINHEYERANGGSSGWY
ncbi:hypothetical protein B0H17DRAFT_1048492 [Mycena rosella]|uniref:Gamma interferon inducible lysosomal thiol reductase GILT n=1 Tax=Mycena rosella TaxID=1033263 RepID=A0AAD7GQJ2_MYCRO|nr:hypothetical protein B0H17DRAFT_1048492 [Mycena rosella]